MNKYQEALDNVKDERQDIIDISADGYIPYTSLKDIKVLQELVDRATPKKYYQQDEYSPRVCPVCYLDIGTYDDFCSHCGQAIDWSE